ncbi:MAG: hypothetical protein K8R74_10550 [Bacteroidales bacterium]|nr:hypothetical protein [Bacteroidales bacterium]
MDNEEQGTNLILEEWKVTRTTIIELDYILSKIRYLTVTVTVLLIGAGFEYSNSALFLLVILINIIFWLLEIHYHKYLDKMSAHARNLENKLDFKLTSKLHEARDEYKTKSPYSQLKGSVISNIYHYIYFAFIFAGLIALVYYNFELIRCLLGR